MSPLLSLILLVIIIGRGDGKYVEGRIDTKENWAFLARFCFLSLEGQFEYLIEFDREMGTPNLLLYYDDGSQWPSVYHSSKSCKERENVLNKVGQNQIIKLSHWYPDTEYSGCIVTRENKELPAAKSPTTSTAKPSTTTIATQKTTKTPKQQQQPPINPETEYYDKFLKGQKATTFKPDQVSTIIDSNSTTWYEVTPTDDRTTIDDKTTLDDRTTLYDELWENIPAGTEENGTKFEELNDVEILFDNQFNGSRKIKRHTALYERFKRRRLAAASLTDGRTERTEKLIVSCHNSRRFRSARERWWFIAISNCDSSKGLDVKYRFLMTNGPENDFWHQHFSADEFYILPVLIAYVLAYVIVVIAVVMCSVELKSRHLLHSTYKLFVISVSMQHCGVLIQALAAVRYAASGLIYHNATTIGQFLSGLSETSFLLLLLLLAKGYTVTRGRLKVAFTVKVTVFMCCYLLTYVVLFIYQAKAFDPGEVLYLYESPAGYGLIILRVAAWCIFAYATYCTVKKFPEKSMFYCPFFICGTLWFYAGPMFILIANSYIDKWVRESVVAAVTLFITFTGHVMFLLLTLPVFANKNFPYHVRTTQIGVMEMTGSSALDSFGPNAYHPGNGAVPQTVIIPLTRRTEELIGNMYSQYMAPGAPYPNGTPRLNGKTASKLVQQSSSDTNTSEDINPYVPNEIFTVENGINGISNANSAQHSNVAQNSVLNSNVAQNCVLNSNGAQNVLPGQEKVTDLPLQTNTDTGNSRTDLPNVLRSRRNILEPIKRDVPVWSLAKGPSVVAMMKKPDYKDPSEQNPLTTLTNGALPQLTGITNAKNNGINANGITNTVTNRVNTGITVTNAESLGKNGTKNVPNVENNGNNVPNAENNGKKVPPVKNGLQPSTGEISTIHEGHVQSYKGSVSNATIDLFNAGKK